MMGHHKLVKKLHAGDSTMHHATVGIADTGKLVGVDAEKHTIKLKRDPIKSLGWPVMTMLFTADTGVDLSGYQSGDTVSFTLKPAGKDDCTIVNIKN